MPKYSRHLLYFLNTAKHLELMSELDLSSKQGKFLAHYATITVQTTPFELSVIHKVCKFGIFVQLQMEINL